MTNSRLTDPEVLEWRFPVRLESFRIRRGSGGAGRHRGGDGVERRAAVPEADDRGDAGQSPARRAVRRGGRRARRDRAQLDRARGRPAAKSSAPRSRRAVERDDVIVIETPGGGGFGQHEQPTPGMRASRSPASRAPRSSTTTSPSTTRSPRWCSANCSFRRSIRCRACCSRSRRTGSVICRGRSAESCSAGSATGAGAVTCWWSRC